MKDDGGMDIGLIFGPAPNGEKDEESPLVELARSVVGKAKGQDLYDLICEIIEEKRGKSEPAEDEESPEAEEY
jgi:hypothetical protein